MIKKSLKRVAAGVIMMGAIFAINPISAHAEWKQDTTGWWYADGDSWYTGWKEVDGKWYYFNNDGYMVHNSYIDSYYLNGQGCWDGTTQISPIKFPSNWTKSVASNGAVNYTISNNGAKVIETTVNINGLGSKEFVNGFIKAEQAKFGNTTINASQQNINGKNVDVLDFKYTDEKLNKVICMHQIIFYDNDKAYMLTLTGIDSISSTDMDAFNEMLKTVTIQ